MISVHAGGLVNKEAVLLVLGQSLPAPGEGKREGEERKKRRERERKRSPQQSGSSRALLCLANSNPRIRLGTVEKSSNSRLARRWKKRWICWDVLDLFLPSFHVSMCFMKFLVHWEGVLPSFHVSVRFLHERHVYGLAELISCLPC